MASTIKVDTIDTPSGSGNITFNRPIAGDGSNLTSLPAHTGNVAFPATQVASADANTLDDYEQGTFTIGQTFSSGYERIQREMSNITDSREDINIYEDSEKTKYE